MQSLNLETLLANIRSEDDGVRAAARDSAGLVGAKAVAPLAKIAAGDELEESRAALRTIQNIVYYAGRPGADEEAKAVSVELLKLLGDSQPLQLRREVLWMTWQIAEEEAVEPVAALLANDDLREAARMTLERLPGQRATQVLQAALASATAKDKPALAYSLRVRGEDTPGVPDLRLIPTKGTSVVPIGR